MPTIVLLPEEEVDSAVLSAVEEAVESAAGAAELAEEPPQAARLAIIARERPAANAFFIVCFMVSSPFLFVYACRQFLYCRIPE